MDVRNKKVVVLGMGQSGLWSVKLLHQKKAHVFAVNSNPPKEWPNYKEISELINHDHCFDESMSSSLFESCDLVILSPGIPRTHKLIMQALSKNIPVVSEIELGFWFLTDEKIIAVTGSNGKTTTVSMLGEMLRLSEKKVFVGGNIGTPLAQYIYENQKCEFIVLELSSFQLESMPTFRAHSNIILNVFVNHTERYNSIEEYAHAKFNLFKNSQPNDLVVYPENFELIRDYVNDLKVKKICFDTSDIEFIKKEIKKDFNLNQFKLAGTHNLSNLFFMLKALSPFNLNKQGIQQAIDCFPGVDYRIQFEKSDDLFICYNDAKSTNWDATLTAVNSLEKKGRELWLILGGRKRNSGDSIKDQIIHLEKKVDKILLIGETAEQFYRELNGSIPAENCGTIEKCIKFAREKSFTGILLFSPAFPSFDQFKNYMDRGDKFHRTLVGI